MTRLWLGDFDPKSDPPRQPDSEAQDSPQRGPRILVVEDELFVAWHLEDILRDLDLDICGVVSEGQGAVDKAAALKPDIVLMDIHLNGTMDGIEAARRIRQVCGADIVFVTAYTDDGVLKRIEREVPSAPVLVKPVSREDIWTAIAPIVDGGAQ
ncbi:MAG: response regulator [Pseudolabrys sp.]